MIYNLFMLEFHQFLFEKFTKWEKEQPTKRSSYSAFARFLSENSQGIKISQPSLDAWINNRYKPSGKYIAVLAEVLGNEVFEIFGLSHPPHLIQETQALYNATPPERLAELEAIYEQFFKDLERAGFKRTK